MTCRAWPCNATNADGSHSPFPIPAHQTECADFRQSAFRLAAPQGPRWSVARIWRRATTEGAAPQSEGVPECGFVRDVIKSRPEFKDLRVYAPGIVRDCRGPTCSVGDTHPAGGQAYTIVRALPAEELKHESSWPVD